MIESTEQFKDAQLVRYLTYVEQRQFAWYNKEVERRERPWCADPIVQEYRFTNNYRRLDPGTKFAVDWLMDQDYASPSDLLFNVLLYRVIGRESTYRRVLMLAGLVRPEDERSFDRLRHVLRIVKEENGTVFSTAYMVPAYDWAPGRDKIDKITWQFAEWGLRWSETFKGLRVATTPQQFYDRLYSLRGVGRFIASQVYVDCTYPLPSVGETLLGWRPGFYEDWMVLGPGALTGLSVLTGRSTDGVEREGTSLLLRLRAIVNDYLVRRHVPLPTRAELQLPCSHPAYPDDRVPLSIHDVQNTCCEFGKYDKISRGTGKARRRYLGPDPHADPDLAEGLRELLGVDPRLRVTAYLDGPGQDLAQVWHRESLVTVAAAKTAGYDLHSGLLVLRRPDPAKYRPEDGTNDPVAEFENHLRYGLGEDVPVEVERETAETAAR